MKFFFTGIILFNICCLNCFAQTLSTLPVYDHDQIKTTYQHPENDTIYVSRFWATWCVICVSELSDFEFLRLQFKNKPIVFQLISVDFPSTADKVEELLQKKHIETRSYLMSPMKLILNGKMVRAIDEIEPLWGDGLPATAIYQKGVKILFKVGKFDKLSMQKTISNLLH